MALYPLSYSGVMLLVPEDGFEPPSSTYVRVSLNLTLSLLPACCDRSAV